MWSVKWLHWSHASSVMRYMLVMLCTSVACSMVAPLPGDSEYSISRPLR